MEHIITKLLQEFEQGKMSRRQLIQSLTLTATAAAMGAAPASAADSKLIKAVNIDHISYQVADYAKSRDFYEGLLGLEASKDDGKSCQLRVGNTRLILRNLGVRPIGTEGGTSGSDSPGVDHIAFTLANWEKDKRVKEAMRAELKRRGLPAETGTSGGFRSVPDMDGLGVQTGGKDQ